MAHAIAHIPPDTLLFERNRRGERVRLGAGAFGVVYKAAHLGAPVAAKCVCRPPPGHPDAAQWPSDVAAFWREAELQYRLRDEHVVVVHGAAEFLDEGGEAEELALVMALAPRGSLAGWLAGEEGRAAPRLPRLRAVLDVARGLRYLHAPGRDVVHADVKPSNVLLARAGARCSRIWGCPACARRGMRRALRCAARAARRCTWRPSCGGAARCARSATCTRCA